MDLGEKQMNFLRRRTDNQNKPKRVKAKKRSISPDEARIQRELDYRQRIGLPNPKVKQLQEKIKSQQRRSYGQK